MAATFRHIVDAPKHEVSYIGVNDYVLQRVPNARQAILDYVKALFPVFQWITRYNAGWAAGDIIAGITVGLVLVTQSMSYAKIATLPPEYGLCSLFDIMRPVFTPIPTREALAEDDRAFSTLLRASAALQRLRAVGLLTFWQRNGLLDLEFPAIKAQCRSRAVIFEHDAR